MNHRGRRGKKENTEKMDLFSPFLCALHLSLCSLWFSFLQVWV